MGSLLVVTCLLVSQGEAAKTPELGSQVRKLVRQLDANDQADRDAAEKELAALGPKVLDYLPRITSRTPAEVKVRLGRVTRELEDALVKATTKPTKVTLKGKMTLQAALAALEEQSGNKVVNVGDREVEVEVDFEDVTYWKAIDQLLDQAGLTLNPFGGAEHALTAMARPEGQLDRHGMAAYSELFRFEVTNIQAVRDLRNPTADAVRIRTEISWEPRLTPISIALPFGSVEATGDDGEVLTVTNPEGQVQRRGQPDAYSVEMDVPFSLPSRSVAKVASLKGEIVAIVPGRVETFEFSDLPDADNDEVKKAGVTVTLENMRKNQQAHEIRVRIRFDESNNALESHRNWITSNEAFVITAKEIKEDNLGFEIVGVDDNEVVLVYRFIFDDDPSSYKFVYRTPALMVRMPVKYELKDIPLP